MQRVNTMISLEEIRARYKRGDHSRHISDQSAHDFVQMIEHGVSIECVIEIMSGLKSTHFDGDIPPHIRRQARIKLAANEIIRRSALFCTLLGVKQIVLAGFNDVKFDTLKAMKLWLELKGYSRLTRSQYRDCYQAWIGKDSVAKVQKMPSGKFLVQEFKIV